MDFDEGWDCGEGTDIVAIQCDPLSSFFLHVISTPVVYFVEASAAVHSTLFYQAHSISTCITAIFFILVPPVSVDVATVLIQMPFMIDVG